MSRSGHGVVLPGLPHYISQQGHRDEPTFQEPTDFRVFLHLLSESCRHHEVAIWSYCVTAQGYSLVLVPKHPDLLETSVHSAALDYAHYHNLRHMVRRQVWGGRGHEVAPLCWSKVWDAMTYVERDPVRREKLNAAWAHPWSSASARVGRTPAPAWLDVEEWQRFWNGSQWMNRLQRFESEAVFGSELRSALRSGTAVGELVAVPDAAPRKGMRKAASRGIAVVAAAG